MCQIVEQETVSGPVASYPAPAAAGNAAAYRDVPKRDQNACLGAVKRKTHNGRAAVLGGVSSEQTTQ